MTKQDADRLADKLRNWFNPMAPEVVVYNQDPSEEDEEGYVVALLEEYSGEGLTTYKDVVCELTEVSS